MGKYIALITLMFPLLAFAIPCDCEVVVFSPMTGSHQMPPTILKSYDLEEYARYTKNSQRQCRKSCLERYQEDMPTSRIEALLLTYSQRLIEGGELGYNCTGLTTLKYPIRVKARLGSMSLGNVVNLIHVVNHEEVCF